jgi:cobaltochelatase CobN
MKRILALTTIGNTAPLKEAVEEIKRGYGDILEVTKVYLHEYEYPDVSLEPIEKAIDEADIILVDIRGDVRIARELPRMLEGKDKTVVVLVAGGQHIWAWTKMGKFRGDKIFKPGKEKEFNVHTYMKTKRFSDLAKKLGYILPFGMLRDMRNWILAQQYYSEGDPENLKNLLLFLLKHYGGVREIKKVPSPKQGLPYGLYIPKFGMCEDLLEYKRRMRFDPEKPTVGVLLYSGMHFEDTKPIADALHDKFGKDLNFIFVFSQVQYNIEALKKYLGNIDLFLNCQYFRIHGGPYGGEPEPTYELLQKWDVPALIGLRTYELDIEKWKESKEGLDPLHIILGVTLPELDGCIEPILVAILKKEDDLALGKVKYMITLDDRITKLGERIKNWIALRKKPNSEKKIAIITYNYPPGEENLASAGYLDVFESLKGFLGKLKERGYKVEVPEGSLKELFLSSGIVNSPDYIRKSGIRIPADEYVRWFKSLPESAQKDVIKHWGEPPGDIMVDGGDILVPGMILGNVFLGIQPSRGVHEDPDKAYHDKDLPPHHQYLAYYFFLEKEFRADAVVHFGMHGTLEFMKGKEVALSSECFPDILIGNMPHIYYYWIGNTSESTIAKRRSYAICISHASPPMKSSGLYEKYLVLEDLLNQYEESEDEKTLEIIKETASELHLPLELSQLKSELYKMKRRLIPYGLHVMDRRLTEEELTEYLLGVLRIDREFPSILKLFSEEMGYRWEEVRNSKIGDEIELQARNVIKEIIDGKTPKWLPDGYDGFVKSIVDRVRESSESEGLLSALEGRYVLPYRGGDPIRDPDVYPSGRAMYGFDPRLIPTVAAEIRGAKAADLLIESYLEKYGRFPETVGIVLWGFETMKTGGDTISTILSLLGVRIKHKESPWFKELEVIPLEELKRPRIDVVITICGIFRDTFKTHIDLLDRAIEVVANLDEPLEKNYIRKHFLQMKGELKDFALARIFGPSPTEYATSMRTLVESSTWGEEKDLVRSYEDSMSYAYFRGRVEKNERAFTNVLKTIDIVTQERDNTEYEVTDLDHYYEFLGGLSRTVQDKKGEKAETLVIDSTEEDVVVEDLKIAIERATRTRLLNPRWIDGMLKHDFHGAKKIKDRVEYLLAFAATTGKVENWVFDEVAERLIFDEEMRKRLQQNNPYATMKIGEILIESERRGYWKVEEEKLRRLQNIILNMEGDIE